MTYRRANAWASSARACAFEAFEVPPSSKKRNDPIKFVDLDGLAVLFVGEGAEILENRVAKLQSNDANLKETLDLYRQPGAPDLIITFGDPLC